jgi:hypothetical protein
MSSVVVADDGRDVSITMSRDELRRAGRVPLAGDHGVFHKDNREYEYFIYRVELDGGGRAVLHGTLNAPWPGDVTGRPRWRRLRAVKP